MRETYKNRPPGVVPIGVSLDREAAALLREYSPTSKSYGKFISRLIYEHRARIEERERLRKVFEEAST